MANIPQQLPDTNAPSFLGYSKPIEEPKPDLSMKNLFEGIGNMLGVTAKAGDTIIKDNIQENLYKDVDATRQQYINEYVQANKDVTGGITPAQKTADASNPMNAMAQATDDDVMPEDVTGVGDQVQSLQAARAAGKISPTTYWMQLDSLAKDYRSRYPGYRQYIDQQISSITGHNPANAAFSSLLQDLNRNLSSTTKEDPWTKMAVKSYGEMSEKGQIPKGQEAAYAQLAQTDPIRFMSFRNSVMAPHNEWDNLDLDNKIRDGKSKSIQDQMRQNLPQQIDKMVWGDINGALTVGNETVQTVQARIKEMSDDPSKADPKAVQDLAIKMITMRQLSEYKIRQWLDTPVGPNGETRAMAAAGLDKDPGEYVNNLLKSRYQVMDNIVGNLTKNRPDLASYQAEWLQNLATNDRYNALKTDFGLHLRMMAIFQNDPKAIKDYMNTILSSDKSYGSANVNVFAKEMMGRFMTNTPNAPVTSIDSAIRQARAAGVESPKLYNDLAVFGTKILSKDLPDNTKVSIAASMFHPSNFGMLDNFKEDQTVTGPDGVVRQMPGKYAIWSTYTSPAMAAEIERLGKDNPQVKQWYKQWTERAFGDDIYGQQIKDLSTTVADPRIKVKMNTGTASAPPQLVIDTSGQDFNDRYAAQVQRRSGALGNLDDQIYKVNQAIVGLSNAARAQGMTDPQARYGYVMSQLRGLGFIPPEPKVHADPKTIADQINNAIISAAKAFNPLAGGDKKSGSKAQGSSPMRLNSSEVPNPTPDQNNAPVKLSPDQVYHYTDEQYGPISGTIKQIFDRFNTPAPKPKTPSNKDQSRVGG